MSTLDAPTVGHKISTYAGTLLVPKAHTKVRTNLILSTFILAVTRIL